MKHPNYIADTNPFRLHPPPIWWLDKIGAFDRDIVIIPSRTRAVFWLTRRKRFAPNYSGKPLDGAGPTPDTQMFITHSLERVVDLACHLRDWSEGSLLNVLTWLSDRDTWKQQGGPLDEQAMRSAMFEGGSRVTRAIEESEQQDERRKAALQRDTIYHATGDGWRSLQARTGRRILNAGLPRRRVQRVPEPSERVGFAPITGATS